MRIKRTAILAVVSAFVLVAGVFPAAARRTNDTGSSYHPYSASGGRHGGSKRSSSLRGRLERWFRPGTSAPKWKEPEE